MLKFLCNIRLQSTLAIEARVEQLVNALIIEQNFQSSIHFRFGKILAL